MKQRATRPNPIKKVDVSPVLYRSVSPGELADIFATGRIVGRGNVFSGDARDMVFFGTESVEDVADQSEDFSRAAFGDPKHAETRARLRAIDESERKARAAFKKFAKSVGSDEWHFDPWEHPKEIRERGIALKKEISKAEDAYRKVQAPWLKKCASEATKATAQNRKKYGATSFVIELRNVPGGTRFSTPHSAHRSDEVGFDRPTGVDASKIVRVYAVLDMKVIREMTPEEAARLVLKGRR